MKKIHIILLVMVLVVPICISQVYAQTLYVDARVGDMDKIEESKYKASGVSIVRNSNGELVSVVRVDASRYLNDPIVDKFLESDPKFLIKQGIVDDKRVSLFEVKVDYYNPECIDKIFEVPGYNDPCNWYHRVFVTILGITDDKGESYHGFRGLNHVYTLKTMDDVTTIWHILSMG
jgi:hypothetical protein